jgi:hypothetical protein
MWSKPVQDMLCHEVAQTFHAIGRSEEAGSQNRDFLRGWAGALERWDYHTDKVWTGPLPMPEAPDAD